jgi:hypothetical protein
MRKIMIYIIRAAFPVFCLLLCIACAGRQESRQEKQSRQHVDTYGDYSRMVGLKIKKLEEENRGLKVENREVYFGNDTLNRMPLSEFGKTPRLCLYFSYNTCPPCIQECVDMLERCIPNYLESENVVFISPDYLPRFRDNCYGKRLLGFRSEALGIPLEKEEVPFFFVLDKDMRINRLHVVNKTDFARTGTYLKEIRDEYAF